MRLILIALLSVFIMGVVAHPGEAYAKKRSPKKSTVSQPQDNPKYAAFVVDGDSGKILFQEDADKLRHPASLTKMMTLYLLFEALDSGKVRMDTALTASSYAAARPATNLFLQEGSTVTVRDAILALVVRSANDVAVMVAEQLGGSEENFAKVMTQRAKQLGMKNTTYRNASGLHHPQQITTAKDQALLGIALKKHYPKYFHFFSRTEFTYNGKRYTGHNRVMQNYPGADGLKTGFVNASGFNLVTTATRRGVNLVGVVLGGRTYASRDAQMIKLLDQSFEKAAASRSKNYIPEYPTSSSASRENYAAVEAANDNYENVEDAEPAAAPTPVQPATQVAPVPATALATTAASPFASASPAAVAAVAEPHSYETNSYVRKVATSPSKTDRYKSNMMVQPFKIDGEDFTPYPKTKPQVAASSKTSKPAVKSKKKSKVTKPKPKSSNKKTKRAA